MIILSFGLMNGIVKHFHTPFRPCFLGYVQLFNKVKSASKSYVLDVPEKYNMKPLSYVTKIMCDHFNKQRARQATAGPVKTSKSLKKIKPQKTNTHKKRVVTDENTQDSSDDREPVKNGKDLNSTAIEDDMPHNDNDEGATDDAGQEDSEEYAEDAENGRNRNDSYTDVEYLDENVDEQSECDLSEGRYGKNLLETDSKSETDEESMTDE